jgi:hypothetical protein
MPVPRPNQAHAIWQTPRGSKVRAFDHLVKIAAK